MDAAVYYWQTCKLIKSKHLYFAGLRNTHFIIIVYFRIWKMLKDAIKKKSTSSLLVLTGAVACRDGWQWVWVHRRCVLILGAPCLDGPQVAVAARPEACRRRQIQSLHRLRFPLAVRYRGPKALPTYLEKCVQTHMLRAEGTTCFMRPNS